MSISSFLAWINYHVQIGSATRHWLTRNVEAGLVMSLPGYHDLSGTFSDMISHAEFAGIDESVRCGSMSRPQHCFEVVVWAEFVWHNHQCQHLLAADRTTFTHVCRNAKIKKHVARHLFEHQTGEPACQPRPHALSSASRASAFLSSLRSQTSGTKSCEIPSSKDSRDLTHMSILTLRGRKFHRAKTISSAE